LNNTNDLVSKIENNSQAIKIEEIEQEDLKKMDHDVGYNLI
jgi:hypothetical protein